MCHLFYVTVCLYFFFYCVFCVLLHFVLSLFCHLFVCIHQIVPNLTMFIGSWILSWFYDLFILCEFLCFTLHSVVIIGISFMTDFHAGVHGEVYARSSWRKIKKIHFFHEKWIMYGIYYFAHHFFDHTFNSNGYEICHYFFWNIFI